MSATELLAELRALAEEIQTVNDERDRLYARRRDLFIAGRSMDPPIGTKELGAAAGVSDVLITNTVKKGAKP